MDIRVACLQGPHTYYPHGSPDPVADRAANLALLERTAAQAAAGDARLLITAEMFLTGYHLGSATTSAMAEPADGPSAADIADIARRHGIAILYGYPERADGGVYNAAQLIGQDGRRLANYRKTHLFGDVDRAAFAAGDELVVQAELDGVVIGLLICYDVEFPEAVRAHALAGTQVLLVPTANMRPFEYVSHQIVPSRAIESQLFIAYANRVGLERDFEYCGESRVVSPDGRELAAAGNSQALIFADLRPEALEASRRLNTYLVDRRTDLYKAHL
ncbi:MAG TPA: carbon-nitrogen hydrolase family protein [Actinocrinis sp.]|jgi:predicted amidohydrolase|nr:carbon-nitrogen hydrolase family protein [Actinocrinis sp.]HEV3168810.1 carbon-nitrogen hydrolase family protein [Actinocrinis sp.]